MDVDTDAVVTFLITWGIPAIMVIRTYSKMEVEDKNDAKKEFKSAQFVSTIGSLIIGCFLASVGNLLTLDSIKFFGIFLMILGGIIIMGDLWRKNKVKSMFVPMLIAVAIFFLI